MRSFLVSSEIKNVVGIQAYLTGVSVTYTAALSRMYECAMLVGNTSIAEIIQVTL